jgi:dihydroorotase
MKEFTLTRPDDWHIHLRDGAALKTTVAHAAAQFARAIVMPNLSPPVTATEQALAYRTRILEQVPAGIRFDPLMTLYLTDNTPAGEMHRAKEAGIAAVKLYPAGATTNSESGVTAIEKVYPVLEAMQTHDLPLLVHGEVTDAAIDIFDREAVFIERILTPLTRRFPALRIVFEHITTRAAVDFVLSAPATVAATITAHHLLYNRNALLAGGVRPHYYCLPVLKREADRQALLRAATSGDPKFFLGTDSAPHERAHKETACGCAGSYTAHAAIELYAEAFEEAGALDRLEGFASRFGSDFYRLPRNSDRITLLRQAWDVPDSYPLADGRVIPLRAGSTLSWRIKA